MVSAVSRSLAGKAAIITGAATGIGRATGLLFARAGARVVLADVRRTELDSTSEEVREVGQATAVVADLLEQEDCEAVVAAAIEAYGRLDVLFNNAGIGTLAIGGTVETIPIERWDLALDTNVSSMYLMNKAAIPRLRAAGGGSIVNTASVAAFRGSPGRPSHAYAASKGA